MSWIESLTKGTALDEAFASAKQDVQGCHVFSERCTVDSKNIKSFPKEQARRYMNQLIKLINSRNRDEK